MAYYSGKAGAVGHPGQKPIDLIEGLTAMQAASLIPYVKITRLDPQTGRPMREDRPLMYDLTRSPQFAGTGPEFGMDGDTFLERGFVSLTSLEAKSNQWYGFMTYFDVTMQFTVHNPAVVFDPGNGIAWRELLEEQNSFSVEYGWKADLGIVADNPVFNGEGYYDVVSGQVVLPSRIFLLQIERYTIGFKANGEADVTIYAKENGDIGLRQTRLDDVLDGTFSSRTVKSRVTPSDEKKSVAVLKSRIEGVQSVVIPGKGKFLKMDDVLQTVMYPLVENACRAFGYDGVDMVVGNFNLLAGRQPEKWGGADLSGRSIGEFLVPLNELQKAITFYVAQGVSLRLHDVLAQLLNVMNGQFWTLDDPEGKPEIFLSAQTVPRNGGHHLVLIVGDRKEDANRTKSLTKLAPSEQSKAMVFSKLKAAGIPILEFGRANSLITEANFDLQPDPQFQGILVDRAYKAPKDREQITHLPDAETRKDFARPHDIIPLSILKGSITMIGNFVMQMFSTLWIEFFGSAQVSGIFNVNCVVDSLRPGQFTTKMDVISMGLDPLNTRDRV